MRRVQLGSLIIDMGVYPRTEVDADHVFNLAEAFRAGAKFPPVVVCSKSLRVVDGAHRVAALQRSLGSSGEIEVIEKRYANDRDFFLDAIKLNSSHGKNLTREDRQRVSELGQALTIDVQVLGSALQMSFPAVNALSVSRGMFSGELSARRSSGSKQKVKRGRHVEDESYERYAATSIDTEKTLPKQRSVKSEDPLVRKLSELEFLVSDCCDAIEMTEVDYSEKHKGSGFFRQVKRMTRICERILGTT